MVALFRQAAGSVRVTFVFQNITGIKQAEIPLFRSVLCLMLRCRFSSMSHVRPRNRSVTSQQVFPISCLTESTCAYWRHQLDVQHARVSTQRKKRREIRQVNMSAWRDEFPVWLVLFHVRWTHFKPGRENTTKTAKKWVFWRIKLLNSIMRYHLALRSSLLRQIIQHTDLGTNMSQYHVH